MPPFKPRGKAPQPGKYKDECPLGMDCLFYETTKGKATRHTGIQAMQCANAVRN